MLDACPYTNYFAGMIDTVRNYIQKYRLIEPGNAVLIALSGGPDSVALTHMLSRLRPELDITLHALYINHGLRPRSSRKEELFCQKLCDQIDITLNVKHADVEEFATRSRISIEEAGRESRYRLLDEVADNKQIQKISLGHHRDDQVETILHRICRGTGIDGLAGMLPCRDRIIRPLLELTRNDILGYLEDQNLSYCIDHSNKSPEFTRNVIRHKILPLLRKTINPEVDTALWNLGQNAQLDRSVLNKVTTQAVKKVARLTAGGKVQVDLSRLVRYDEGLRFRVLRKLLANWLDLQPAPDRAVIFRLDRMVMGDLSALSLPNKIQARKTFQGLFLYRPRKVSYEKELAVGKSVRLELPQYRIRARRKAITDVNLEFKRRARKVFLDSGKLGTKLVVRSLQPGDRFRPLGMKGSKKVSDYLTDRKVPALLNDEIVVVADSKGIVWLVGYEIADRVKIDRTSKEVIEIEFAHRRDTKQTAR